MKLKYGNIWSYIAKCDAICIPTNGTVRKDKRAVMGAGLAFQARKKFTDLDKTFGKILLTTGSRVQEIHTVKNTKILAFPTKKIVANKNEIIPRLKPKINTIALKGLLSNSIPGWAAKSCTDRIELSCNELIKLAEAQKWNRKCCIVLPKVGCGNGGLSWDRIIRPLLEKYLDDRFLICTGRNPNEQK